jgi:hypothetical protein
MTMATDYVLAASVVWLGLRLLGPEGGWPRRLWAIAYVVGGATAALGGTVHGFPDAFSLPTRALLWDLIESGIATAALALLAGTAAAALGGLALRLFLLALAARAVADLVAGASGDFVFAIEDGVAALLGVLGFGLYGLLRGQPEARFLLAGVLVCLGGACVQIGHLVPHRLFNHNDLFHVVVVIGACLLFQAVRRFGREAKPTGAS